MIFWVIKYDFRFNSVLASKLLICDNKCGRYSHILGRGQDGNVPNMTQIWTEAAWVKVMSQSKVMFLIIV